MLTKYNCSPFHKISPPPLLQKEEKLFVERVKRNAFINFSVSSAGTHCVEIVQIRSYFWSVFSCIRDKYRKIRTRNNSILGHFSRSDSTRNKYLFFVKALCPNQLHFRKMTCKNNLTCKLLPEKTFASKHIANKPGKSKLSLMHF